MKKFIKLALVTLCLSLSAATLIACKEDPAVPTAKTELDAPIIASAVYTGEVQKAVVPENAGYAVTTNDGGVSAGEYDVVLTLSDSEKYVWKTPDEWNPATVTIKFYIAQADNEIISLVMSDRYIDEEAKAPTAEARFGTPVFTYSDAANGDYTDVMPTAPGKYFVKATVAETSDYKGAERVSHFVISKNKPAFTLEPIKIDGLKYDGGEHELVTAGATENGVVEYKLGVDGEWSETIPTATDAGVYEVYYRIKGDETHGDLEVEEPIIVTIGETEFNFTAPAKIEGLKYNGSEQELIVAGSSDEGKIFYKLGEDGVYGEAVPTATIPGEYTVYYKLESDNGNVIFEQHLTATIEKTSEIAGFTLTDKVLNCGDAPKFTVNVGDRTVTLKYSRSEKGPFEEFEKLFEGDALDLVGNGIKYYVQASLEDDECYENAVSVPAEFTLYHKFADGLCASCNHAQTGVVYGEDENGSAFVKEYKGNPSTELYVLKTYNGKPVKYIATAAPFKNNSDLTKVVLPDSITALNELEFYECSNLEYLSIAGVTSFGGNSITHCYNLKTLIVKEGITIPGQQLQSDNGDIEGITSVCILGSSPITIENADLNRLIGNIYYLGDGVKCGTWGYGDNGKIITADHLFVGGKCETCGLYGEELTKGVVYKYDSNSDSYYVSAYRGASETVEVLRVYNDGMHGEKAVTYVAKAAFSGSSAHNSANFANCKKIKKVILPESVTDLGGWVFAECDNLEYVDARGVKSIIYAAAGRPDGANESNHNFRGCPKLTTVIIGDGYSSNICQFTTTNNTKTIDLYVYGNKVITVQNGEENSDDALTGDIYYLGDGVKCKTWKFGDNGEIVKGAAAHNYDNGVCTICGVKDAMGVIYTYNAASDSYYVAAYTGSAETVRVFDTWNDGTHGEKAVTYVAKAAFSGSSHHNAANFANCKKIKKVILPESVTDLGGWVFAECDNLEYVDARGVKSIIYAAAGRPDGANESNHNFRGCPKLTTVIIGDGYSSNICQFTTTNNTKTIDLYVYGSNAITVQKGESNADDALTGNIYYYSETESAGAWHFDGDGNVALW